ncbi:MAG: hypothetical protein ACQERD_08275 [Campylobacterota bacterium]
MEILGIVVLIVIVWFMFSFFWVGRKKSQYKNILELLNQKLDDPEYQKSDVYTGRLNYIDEVGFNKALIDYMNELDYYLSQKLNVNMSLLRGQELVEARNYHMMRYAIAHEKGNEMNNILTIGSQVEDIIKNHQEKKQSGISNKELINSVNKNAKYTNELESIILFAEIQLLSINKNLFSENDKFKIIVAFFGGVADYMSQNLNLNDKNAITFITYCLAVIFDFKENRYEELANLYLSIANQDKYMQIQIYGVQAYQDIFKDDADNTEIGMRLYKLLRNENLEE